MNLEEENKEKRKEITLTTEEWLTFFFFPIDRKDTSKTTSFNEIEDQSFDKYGFDKKQKQSSDARVYGCAFYALLLSIIGLILIW